MPSNLLKSILHNIGVVAVGFGFAWIGAGLDMLLGWHRFSSLFTGIAGGLLILAGFMIRVWATYDFYQRQMKVIVLKAQRTLITTGPYRFTRNPLYLGGNIFIFGGAVILLGTPGGLILTVIEIIGTDFMIRREEKQLEKTFGRKFTNYKRQVRRWF
jgi:protein-S-isoprenylcysteine O-methyltransferase Ste14